MSLRHKISHLLHLNLECQYVYSKNGRFYTGQKCIVCGAIRNEKVAYMYSQYRDTLDKLNNL